MDFSSSYLTEQIIAYIGNKRKLLPLIYSAIEKTGLEIKPGLKFLDAFSGSGVVARFAKELQFEVFANDWEYYSNVINRGFLETNKSDIRDLFGSEEKFYSVLNEINNLPPPNESEQYIAKYYAPKEFEADKADYRTERLFYTRQNALAIDKIRNYIEDNFSDSDKRKNLLLAELIYEAATHNNTSGVFKAFHKEFGGHGKDALKRIFGKIQLNVPVLTDSKQKMHIFMEDANLLARKLQNLDIAYLDPPYNQHQYGSNYHILNTIAKWDHVPASLELNNKGVLKEKAGIRHDWVQTRSSYCYKDDAQKSFEDLIENLDAKHILVSYSTDGIIPFEKMLEICMKRGKLSLVTNEYTTYRGGKQSNKRQNANIEFILCIDTSKKSDEGTKMMIDSVLAKKKFMLLFKQKFSQKKLKSICKEITKVKGKAKKDEGKFSLLIQAGGTSLTLESDYFFTLSPSLDCDIAELSSESLKKLHDLIMPCACETKEEELFEIISHVENDENPVYFAKMIPQTLKKLAHKKNRETFYEWAKRIDELKFENPSRRDEIKSLIDEKVSEVKKIAEIRFNT